jgi:hypothetical protein
MQPQSHVKAPKRRLRYMPSLSTKCQVCLQHWRQQQPGHKNERRGALDAAAAMRSNGPENQPAFPAARVTPSNTQSTQALAREVHSTLTARASRQPHLHLSHATPRHTLHYQLSPAPCAVGDEHTSAGAVVIRGHNNAHVFLQRGPRLPPFPAWCGCSDSCDM